MTTRLSSKYLVLLLSVGFFFSCKKDDSPAPAPAKPTLVETIAGRWDAQVPLPPRVSNPSVSPKSQDMPYITSVEFFSDSSYTVVMNHYHAFKGKFTVTDSATISVGGELGSLSGLSVKGDSLSITYDYYDMHFNIKAVKVPNIQVSDAKKALLKNWLLTKEEGGAASYEHAQNPDYIYWYFSVGGRFIMSQVNGQDSFNMAMDWKWHATEADAIEAHSPWDEDGETPYIKIVELTSTKLKVQEIVMENSEKVVQNTYILTAAQ